MCGILGIVGNGNHLLDRSRVEAMLSYLQFRGPDENGIAAFPNCVLGHTRLSIIDLSTGQQPMFDSRKSLAITFNGEIYNFRELRAELIRRGHAFSTKSDTEVILNAYIEYGIDCAAHLDGMFAFAIWDEDRKSLFMARDRFGKKPLYYGFGSSGQLIFASEIKAMLASGLLEAEIDHASIRQYLQLMYVPPFNTAFAEIQTVKPAHVAVFENGKLSAQRYWDLKWNPSRISYAAAKEELRHRLREAVKKRLVADVEIGSLLSGGVDSTLVTQYAQEQSTRPIKSFSVGYGEYINELPFAKQASEAIGTDHYTLQANGDLTSDLIKVVEYFDEPHADSSDVSQYLVSRLAQSKVKVVLSGDGGDEVFLGYPWYLDRKEKTFRQRLRETLFAGRFNAHLDRMSVFDPQDMSSLWLDATGPYDSFVAEIRSLRITPYKKVNHFDLTVYLPGQLLTKADRAGMMTSLEVRSPFLDHSLVEFVYNLPERYKTDRRTGKIILKDLLSEKMPAEFVNRPKQGFGAPVRYWLREGSMKTLVQDLFVGSEAAVFSFLNRNTVRELVERFYTHKIDAVNNKLWLLLCLELWLKSITRYSASSRAAWVGAAR